jgi:hypothetical protein
MSLGEGVGQPPWSTAEVAVKHARLAENVE